MLLEKQKLLLITTFLILLIPLSSGAQQNWKYCANKADSLRRAGDYEASIPLYRKVLNTIPKSEREAVLSNNIRIGLSYFMLGQNLTAQAHFKHVLEKTENDTLNIYRGHALNNLGLLYDNLGLFEQSIQYYERALYLFEKIENPFQIDLTKMNIGIVHQKRGQYREGLRLLTQAAIGFLERGDSSQLGEVYSAIAGIQDILGHPIKAKHFYRESITIRKRIHDRYGLATTYNNLGIIAMNENSLDSASHYYAAALDLMRETSNRNIGLVYHNLGLLSMKLEDRSQARHFFRKAFEHKKGISDTSGMVITLNKQVELELEEKNYLIARKYLEHSKQLLNRSLNPKNLKEHYDQWKEYYKCLGYGDSALIYLEKSNTLSRIINEENYQKELALLQESFEADKRNSDIKRLHESNEHTKGDLNIAQKMIRYRNLFLVFLGIVLLAMIIVLYFRRQQATKRELRARIQGIEIEKNRLSQELHDMTGTEIRSIKSDLEKYFSSAHTTHIDEFAPKIQKRIHALSSSIIRISHELKLPDFSYFPFSTVLCDMIYDWNEFKNYHFIIEIEDTRLIDLIPKEHAQHVYRFIAESLTNIDKHAQATDIVLRSHHDEKKLRFLVIDNGVSSENTKSGIGHRNLNERAQEIKGKFEFTSTANGTISSFSIPLPT